MHPFEKILSVAKQDIEFEFRAIGEIGWLDFVLNPRRLRGSDFLMRWSQGVWSEQRLVDAINMSGVFFALAYGPSGTAPTQDVRAFELYFERLEAAGLGQIKRPDLLIFRREDAGAVAQFAAELGGIEELPFVSEADLKPILDKALMAIECENSLWVAEKMPHFKTPLKPQKRLGGKLGLSKSSVLPTVIIKEEDRLPLLDWQTQHHIPIHVWHVFFDRAYGLALDKAERLVADGFTEPIEQVFQAPGGATTKKMIYKHYYHYAYPLGTSIESPKLVPEFIEDKNGHILPFVRFTGGTLKLTHEVLEIIKAISDGKN